MRQISTKIKIILILVISFVITQAAFQTVFLANSPRINQPFLLALRNFPSTVVNGTRTLFASIGKSPRTEAQKNALKNIENLPATALNQVGQGVYAKEDSVNNIVYIRITEDAEWEEKIIDYNGKQYTVRFPKGSFK